MGVVHGRRHHKPLLAVRRRCHPPGVSPIHRWIGLSHMPAVVVRTAECPLGRICAWVALVVQRHRVPIGTC